MGGVCDDSTPEPSERPRFRATSVVCDDSTIDPSERLRFHLMCASEVCDDSTLEPSERLRFRAPGEVGRGILLARAPRDTAALRARQCSIGRGRGAGIRF